MLYTECMIRVGVLRGGTNNRYDHSLASGAFVIKNLSREEYEVLDIYIDTEGVWHLGGVPVSHDKLRHRVDVIWNALHGYYGEDGKAAQLLENLGLPYTSASPLAAAVAMNKKLTKDVLAQAGVKTPRGVYIEDWGTGDREGTVLGVTRSVAEKLSPPWIVEAISRGNGDGPMRAKTREELSEILFTMFDASIPTLIEEAVLGTEVSVISMSGFRGQPTYTFLPQHKESLLARFQKKESELFQNIAREVHDKLGLGAYSRVHMAIDRRGQVSVLGVETLPMTHAEAELHDALEAVGSSFGEFARHLITHAVQKHR
jgi:D-alanine-D-alanine ligase